jgi:hypothetical protein
LYSFLGIFIIFIVDSFVRVGRYIRWKKKLRLQKNQVESILLFCL